MSELPRLPISVDLTLAPADIAAVRAGVMAHNDAAVGRALVQPLALYVRDESGTIRGGLVGYLAWQWLYVDLLWVDTPLRGRGTRQYSLRKSL